MNISKLVNICEKPELYTLGDSSIWTDAHISQNLLDVHLNEHVDLATRKPESIQAALDLILAKLPETDGKVLDLGCGPGIYAEKLATLGHQVTGVDINPNSIAYAQEQAQKNQSGNTFINGSYLDLKSIEKQLDQGQFDLIMMIYTDFGVLVPEQRDAIFFLVKKYLKPNGFFIFDVLNDNHLEQKSAPKNWECPTAGFWSAQPFLVLSESFTYPEASVILSQHVLLQDDVDPKVFRFWTHFFSKDSLQEMIWDAGLKVQNIRNDVLPEDGIWNGENVWFAEVKI